MIVGIVLLAPLAISVLAAGAGPRLPVAIRIALRDLVRYRARSGAALAATTFAVFLAMAICLVASIEVRQPARLDRPQPVQQPADRLHAAEPGARHDDAAQQRPGRQPGRAVNSLAASLHARSVVPLESAGGLYQAGTPANSSNFTGSVYVATPQLLATYGIKASQIAPGTDILTMRPGLAGLPHMEMTWGNFGTAVRYAKRSRAAAVRPAR